MRKNQPNQYWRVFAFDRTTGDPVTGIEDHITAKISLNGASIPVDLANNAPTEIKDAGGVPAGGGGYYQFALSQEETDAYTIDIYPIADPGVYPNVQVIGMPEHQEATVIQIETSEPSESPSTAFDILKAILARLS